MIQTIKDWLLSEGIKNDVIPDYSALEIYLKVDIPTMLKQDISDETLGQIAYVLDSMFEEGPVMGISALREEGAAQIDHRLDIPDI